MIQVGPKTDVPFTEKNGQVGPISVGDRVHSLSGVAIQVKLLHGLQRATEIRPPPRQSKHHNMLSLHFHG
jgi:hypothetical protein